MVHDRLTSPSNIAVWKQTKLQLWPINKLETVLAPSALTHPEVAVCAPRAGAEQQEAQPLVCCLQEQPAQQVGQTWHQTELAHHAYGRADWALQQVTLHSDKEN